MNISLACGGTGGHIFPGLATASVLKERGHDVVLWLAGKDVEKTAVKDWDGDVFTVPAEGFPSSPSLRGVRAAWKLLRASMACTRLMRSRRPDVLLAMGSYASVGPVCAALRLHVPVVLHEANVLPGRAISLFSRWAASVAASFEETRFYMRRKNLVITGMPLRRELDRVVHYETGETPDRNLFTVLVMGGSRGAEKINVLLSEVLCTIQQTGHEAQVIHLAGLHNVEELRERYHAAGVKNQVLQFTQDMASMYSATDLAVCRAGAATCAELSAFGVPALLIPYPFAANDHQTANARALEKAGAADVVAESDLSAEWLVDYITDCIRTPSRLARMSAASRRRAMRHGAEALADVVEQAARKKIDQKP